MAVPTSDEGIPVPVKLDEILLHGLHHQYHT